MASHKKESKIRGQIKTGGRALRRPEHRNRGAEWIEKDSRRINSARQQAHSPPGTKPAPRRIEEPGQLHP